MDIPQPAPADDRPPMTYQEASWHAHTAAVRAQPDAATSPSQDLAAAALGAVTVCGITFQPLTAGALLAVQAAARLAADAGNPIEGADEAALLVYCLAESQTAFRIAEASQLKELLSQARALLAPVPLADLPKLTSYCSAAIAQATGAQPEPEKKTGTDPVTPTAP